MALLTIHDIPVHHWSCNDISKLIAKSAHLIGTNEETNTKSCMDSARVLVGCKDLPTIPQHFNVVIGDQLCTIKIEIKYMWENPRRTNSTSAKGAYEITETQGCTSALVGEDSSPKAGKVGASD